MTQPAETRTGGTDVQAERTSAVYVAQVLRDRAESYWRDSVVFREDGDLHAAVAYKMIAEELRLCADILGPTSVGEAGPDPQPARRL